MVSGMIDESPNMLKEIMEKDNATVAEVEEKMESLEKEIAGYEKALKKEKTSEMEEKLQKAHDAYDQLAFCQRK